MRHVLDTVYRGHELILLAAPDGTYTVDIRADAEAGELIAGHAGFTAPIQATAWGYDRIDQLVDGVGGPTPTEGPIIRHTCFTCGTSKVRHYQTYEWVHALPDSLCDDVANPMPIIRDAR